MAFCEERLSDIQSLFTQGPKLVSIDFTDSVKILYTKGTQSLLSDLAFREKRRK